MPACIRKRRLDLWTPIDAMTLHNTSARKSFARHEALEDRRCAVSSSFAVGVVSASTTLPLRMPEMRGLVAQVPTRLAIDAKSCSRPMVRRLAHCGRDGRRAGLPLDGRGGSAHARTCPGRTPLDSLMNRTVRTWSPENSRTTPSTSHASARISGMLWRAESVLGMFKIADAVLRYATANAQKRVP